MTSTVERPILFSGAMVKAILAGTKTVTRRVVSPQPPDWATQVGISAFTKPGHLSARGHHPELGTTAETSVKRRFNVGERLWVRETWGFDSGVREDFRPMGRHDLSGMDLLTHTLYAADGGDASRWRPSIHMPRWAARITLEITGVVVERLQGLTGEQALAEGVGGSKTSDTWLCVPEEPEAGPFEVFVEPDSALRKEHGLSFVKHQPGQQMLTTRQQFANLWDEINGSRAAWASNPWVWAVSFRRVTP